MSGERGDHHNPWLFRRDGLTAILLVAGSLALTQVGAFAADAFGIDAAALRVLPGHGVPEPSDCAPDEPLPQPLTLGAAFSRAFCANPKTHEAWAQFRVQAAAVGVSRSAYLPTLTANVQSSIADKFATVSDHPELSSAYRQGTDTQSLILNWVLFDFGRRAADLKSNEQALAAAQANHAAVLLDLFADVARAYHAAQAAEGAVRADQEIDATAKNSYSAAQGRVERGVAPVTDALQAKTAYAESTLQLQKAQSDLLLAQGVLAGHLGVAPDASFSFPPLEAGVHAPDLSQAAVADLIRAAQAVHPRILQATAQTNAALARLDQARAETMPTLSLSVNASHNTGPVSASLGAPQLASHGNDRGVSLALSIPIFDGFGRYYKITQADRQVEVERARAESMRQQVATDVWAAYHSLQAAERAMEQVATLQEVAGQSLAAANERYLAGVGGIVDLLNAQSALAAARRRNQQALADWQAARLALEARLGVLPRH